MWSTCKEHDGKTNDNCVQGLCNVDVVLTISEPSDNFWLGVRQNCLHRWRSQLLKKIAIPCKDLLGFWIVWQNWLQSCVCVCVVVCKNRQDWCTQTKIQMILQLRIISRSVDYIEEVFNVLVRVLQMPLVQCILYKLMLIYRAKFKWWCQTYQIVSTCCRKNYTNSAAVTTMQFSCAVFWIPLSSSGNFHLVIEETIIYVWFSCCHAF